MGRFVLLGILIGLAAGLAYAWLKLTANQENYGDLAAGPAPEYQHETPQPFHQPA